LPIYCSNETYENTEWPETQASNQLVYGTCLDGYAGAPQRNCSFTGTWGSIQSPCVLVTYSCPNENFENATWSRTAANQTVFALGYINKNELIKRK